MSEPCLAHWGADNYIVCSKCKIAEQEARIAELEDALKDAWSGMRYIRETHGELYGVGFDRVDEKCRALLGGGDE